jgi:hypothetical protein
LTHQIPIAIPAVVNAPGSPHTLPITASRPARDKQGHSMAITVKKPAAKKKIAPKAKKCGGGKKGK